ncbi:MAG: M12 family metallo-peptidase [Desulfobacterales bacterium]|nr:M12 family metallo-peptidase [Desulfobacterales bacterium]
MEIPENRFYRLRSMGCSLAVLLFILFAAAPAAPSTTIDIMLVYDTTATSWVAQNGGLTAFSQDTVNRLNLSLQNSEVDISFRLVHSVAVDYTHENVETENGTDYNLDTDLNAITYGDGAFAEVHTLRDDYGADVVALLVDTGTPYGWVGVGWLLSYPGGSPGYAFTASAIQSVAISTTLDHEIGHNLGADHAKDQKSYPGPNKALASYSAGWYFPGTKSAGYHTIMAYSDKDGNGYPDYQSAPLFSTPLVTYEGTPAGDAADGDNARLLCETMDAVADYRDSMGTLQVAIEPAEACADGARWRRAGTEIWLSSDETEWDLPAGDYTIEFKAVTGWDKPADQGVTVLCGQTTTETGQYTLPGAKPKFMPWIPLLLKDD